jgi:hypothetical protein
MGVYVRIQKRENGRKLLESEQKHKKYELLVEWYLRRSSYCPCHS